MVGTTGMSPADGVAYTAFPGRLGSNIDCSVKKPGSTLCLPVHVDWALLDLGDVQASTGHEEVSGTGVAEWKPK